MRTFTWEEISQHNHTHDCWLVCDGAVYDVTEWVQQHPGGISIATLAGEDATHSIHSAHLRDITPVLDRYCIGHVRGYTPRFNQNDSFLETLKERVRLVLENEESVHSYQDRTLGMNIVFTSLLLITCWLIMYLTPPWGVIAAIPMGMATCALIGSFGHERIHGNLHPWLDARRPLYRVMNCLLWGILIPFMPERYFQYEHIKHHEHPMDAERDFDVYALSYFLRLSPDVKWRWHHRFQYYYAPLIYGCYIFIQVIAGYLTSFFDDRRILRDDKGLLDVGLMKFIALMFHIVIPALLTDWLTVSICAGLYFFTWQACIYATSGTPHMTNPELHPEIDETWSHYICRTTVSVKVDNRFFGWLCGGLNYHLEHHLLPSVPRKAMMTVAPIVRATCEEFEHPYCCYSSFIDFYKDHSRFLIAMSAPEEDGASIAHC